MHSNSLAELDFASETLCASLSYFLSENPDYSFSVDSRSWFVVRWGNKGNVKEKKEKQVIYDIFLYSRR